MRAATLLSAAMLLAGAAQSQQPDRGHRCGPIRIVTHYGPYDYITERPKLDIVEGAHFTPKVEALIAGQSGALSNDLNYMLKSSPNHHRALISLYRLSMLTTEPQPTGFEWPLECYYDRAIRFKPEDPIVRMIYAQFLQHAKRTDDAVAQLDAAIAMSPDVPQTQYNAGLIFYQMGLLDRALEQAHAAIKLGWLRPELPDLLKKANRWKEPAD